MAATVRWVFVPTLRSILTGRRLIVLDETASYEVAQDAIERRVASFSDAEAARIYGVVEKRCVRDAK